MTLRLKTFTIVLFAIIFLSFDANAQKTQELTEEELRTWWQKDIEQDTIPGISLERAYDEILKDKIGNEVVVAVLDTKLDIDHEDLKEQIWVNMDEIPDNGIDDDKNGYIDDVNGWNFLGNSEGDKVPYQSAEVVRVIKRYEKKYPSKGAPITSIPADDTATYEKAKKELLKEQTEHSENLHYLDSLKNLYFDYKKEVVELLKGNVFNKEVLDSLIVNKLFDEDSATWMKDMIDWGIENENYQSYIDENNTILQTLFSLDFNEREFVDGGNAKVKDNSLPFQHATPVSGIIVATRENNIGIKGFSDQIKIMPVVMVSYGDEHDEDVANAIRYAVDNGAQIINMSWGKYYSTQMNLVKEAFAYAAQKNVLLVTASGNNGKNIDMERNYPTDFYGGQEFFETFIMAGGTTSILDSTLVASFSNYGKVQVDLFAPAKDIYSLNPDNTYASSRGTSYASPIIAGTAALLKSHFPNLTAVQLKEIILESGTKLDVMVKRPGDENDNPLISFSELSKTGKIVNAYKALKMAEEVSKKSK